MKMAGTAFAALLACITVASAKNPMRMLKKFNNKVEMKIEKVQAVHQRHRRVLWGMPSSLPDFDAEDLGDMISVDKQLDCVAAMMECANDNLYAPDNDADTYASEEDEEINSEGMSGELAETCEGLNDYVSCLERIEDCDQANEMIEDMDLGSDCDEQCVSFFEEAQNFGDCAMDLTSESDCDCSSHPSFMDEMMGFCEDPEFQACFGNYFDVMKNAISAGCIGEDDFECSSERECDCGRCNKNGKCINECKDADYNNEYSNMDMVESMVDSLCVVDYTGGFCGEALIDAMDMGMDNCEDMQKFVDQAGCCAGEVASIFNGMPECDDITIPDACSDCEGISEHPELCGTCNDMKMSGLLPNLNDYSKWNKYNKDLKKFKRKIKQKKKEYKVWTIKEYNKCDKWGYLPLYW
jgi:hypothetical protein